MFIELFDGERSDVFVFAPKSGADQITDFTDGADRIDLSAYGFASFAAARGHFANVGADCVFTVGADVLTVAQFNLSLLGAADLLL